MERHCDSVTMDHIVELRKRLAIVERQRDNALSVVNDLRRENFLLRGEFKEIACACGEECYQKIPFCPHRVAANALKEVK